MQDYNTTNDTSSYNTNATFTPKPEDLALLDLINQVRQDPSSLIPDLEAMLPNFDGNWYYDPDGKYWMATYEGSSAVEEAIQVLSNTSSL